MTERDDFPSIRAAWEHAADMGSRWFFYPILVVTAGRSKVIRGVPDGIMEEWEGRQLATFLKTIREEADAVAEFVRGEAPWYLAPPALTRSRLK